MIAPPWYHLRYKDGLAYPKDVYANDEEYFWDISQAVRAELDILYEAGVRNVQFDDPNFACKVPTRPGSFALLLTLNRFLLRENDRGMGKR
jgi:methionine synthase II (cobalamin-independent)